MSISNIVKNGFIYDRESLERAITNAVNDLVDAITVDLNDPLLRVHAQAHPAYILDEVIRNEYERVRAEFRKAIVSAMVEKLSNPDSDREHSLGACDIIDSQQDFPPDATMVIMTILLPWEMILHEQR